MRSTVHSLTAAGCLTGALLAATLALPQHALAQSAAPTGTQSAPAGSSGAAQPASPMTAPTAAPSAAPATAPAHTPAMTHHAAARPGDTMQAMVEQRIKDLHVRLHITSAEQSQWDQFSQAMRDNAKASDDLYQAREQKMASMTAVENMQSYAEIAQQHATDMQKLVPAFQTLYDSFTDQQKKQADEVFRSYAEQAQQRRTTAQKAVAHQAVSKP